MKFRILMLVVASLSLVSSFGLSHEHPHPPFTGHLSFKENSLHLHAEFPVAPQVGEESLMVLQAMDPKTHQKTELKDSVEVVLWMPSMGHGSAPTQVERAFDQSGHPMLGTFLVRNVNFIMGGDWEVRVTLTDAQGAQETKSFTVTLNGGHDHGGHAH